MNPSQSQIAEALEQCMNQAVADLIAGNVTGIVRELTEADDGKMTVSFSVKLSHEKGRVSGVGAISYSRKFKDETEFITAEPDQIELPIEGSVTIVTANEEATMTAQEASKAYVSLKEIARREK